MGDFGPTVSRLQSNVQGLQEETETCQRAAGELRERRDSLQRRVDEADRQLAERRAALNQFQFKLKSQGLLVEDCEKRAKGETRARVTVGLAIPESLRFVSDQLLMAGRDSGLHCPESDLHTPSRLTSLTLRLSPRLGRAEAERENAAVQAELTQLRDAIAIEKRERLTRLEAADGRVQSLVRRFRDAASLTEPDAAGQVSVKSHTVSAHPSRHSAHFSNTT